MTTKTMLGLVVLAIGLSIIPAFAEIRDYLITKSTDSKTVHQ